MTIIKRTDIPYLNEEVLEKYKNVIIVSSEGLFMKMNSLILCALSHALKAAFSEEDDDHTIITEFSLEELKQVKEFCMRGTCDARSKSILETFGLLKKSEIKLSDNLFNETKIEPLNSTSSNSRTLMKTEENSMINSEISIKNEFIDIKEEPIDDRIEFDPILEYSSDESLPLKMKNKKKKKITKKLEYDGVWEPGRPSKIKAKKGYKKTRQVCDVCQKSCNNLPKHMNDHHNEDIDIELSKSRNKRFSYEDLALFQKFELPQRLEEYLKQPQKPTKQMEETVRDMTKPIECPQCHLRFSAKERLKMHLIKHHNEHLQCKYCILAFCLEDSEKFQKHMFFHLKNSALISCIQCGFVGTKSHSKITALKEHLEKRGPLHNDECSQCSKKMPTYEAYQDHVKEEHFNIWKYKCGALDCGAIFITSEESKKHYRSVHTQHKRERKKYIPRSKGGICDQCGITFRNLSTHKSAIHGDPVICKECGRKCPTAYSLKVHIKKVHVKKICPVCGDFVNDLSRHKKTKHSSESDKPHGCQTCGKRFWEQRTLEEHYNVHTGAKPFKCKFCSTGFGSYGTMLMHQKGHLGIKRKSK